MSEIQQPDAVKTDSMDSLRSEIDETDSAILDLLARRRNLSERIAAVKQVLGVPAYVPERHTEVLGDRVREGVDLGLPSEFVRDVMGFLLKDSVAVQVPILGGSGVPPEADLHRPW